MSDLATLAALGFHAPPPAREEPDLARAAQEFESYLLTQLLRQGSKPFGEETLLDGGPSGRMMRDMFHQELARLAAERGGFGLAEAIQRQADASSGASEQPKREEP